ncbi:hypothetical protein MMC28_002531, partial [Mycoblastus sanguinarius]|nr:hypothetical protein [Mycoblastus sanguinarius]
GPLPMSPSSTHERYPIVKFEPPRSTDLSRSPARDASSMTLVMSNENSKEKAVEVPQEDRNGGAKGTWLSRLVEWKSKSKSGGRSDAKELC